MLTKVQGQKPPEQAVPTKASCTTWATTKCQTLNSKTINREPLPPQSSFLQLYLFFTAQPMHQMLQFEEWPKNNPSFPL